MVAVKNIARRLGDDISESKPILDSRLSDGNRVAAVIPPCSLGGITLTIRKFNTRDFEMEDLIREGSLDRLLALSLARIISTIEMNKIKRDRVTCCMLESRLLRPFGEGQGYEMAALV
jgi:Flp pilus assembly CpaF family ATPase